MWSLWQKACMFTQFPSCLSWRLTAGSYTKLPFYLGLKTRTNPVSRMLLSSLQAESDSVPGLGLGTLSPSPRCDVGVCGWVHLQVGRFASPQGLLESTSACMPQGVYENWPRHSLAGMGLWELVGDALPDSGSAESMAGVYQWEYIGPVSLFVCFLVGSGFPLPLLRVLLGCSIPRCLEERWWGERVVYAVWPRSPSGCYECSLGWRAGAGAVWTIHVRLPLFKDLDLRFDLHVSSFWLIFWLKM